MPTFEESKTLLCSGVINYPCEDDPTKVCRGYLLFPCGASSDTAVEGSTEQLPFRYQVWRERARLLPCCYWQNRELSVEDTSPLDLNRPTLSSPDLYEFDTYSVEEGVLPKIKVVVRGNETEIDNPDLVVIGGWRHQGIPDFYINPTTFDVIVTSGGSGDVSTLCTHPKAERWNQGLDKSPPCNGAKTGCPFYTNRFLKYNLDEQTAPGKPITGQMVQELRHYLREWTQDAWEAAFEIPYIWAKDFEDRPMTLVSERGLNQTEQHVYTILTRVFWDIEAKEVVLTKVPSSAKPADQNKEDPNFPTPPYYPTVVKNLGLGNVPSITVTFPIRIDWATGNDAFVYKYCRQEANKLYFAGRSLPLANVYVINQEYVRELPNLENYNLSEKLIKDTLDSLVRDLVKKQYTFANVVGFKHAVTNYNRFWEVTSGVEVVPGLNFIYCLVKDSNGNWEYTRVKVDALQFFSEVIQEEFPALFNYPVTTDLRTRIARIPVRDGGIKFKVTPLYNSLTISKVYHACVFDRSLSDFFNAKGDRVVNQRFWKVVERFNSRINGNRVDLSNSSRVKPAQLGWYYLDYCNKYLLEITLPELRVAAVPVGLDRFYEPTNIVFRYTDSFGRAQEIQMKVSYRELDGIRLPVRFFVVEPEDDTLSVALPTNAEVSLDLRIFSAENSQAEGEDILPELLPEFSAGSRDLSSCGVPIVMPGQDDSIGSSHKLTVLGDRLSFVAEDVSRYDMTYVVELEDETGEVIATRKVAGIAEMSDSWIRDVEIFYRWSANQQAVHLLPNYYRNIDGNLYSSQGPPSNIVELKTVITSRIAGCSDHDPSLISKGGGLLYKPYEQCEYPTIRHYGIESFLEFTLLGYSYIDEKYRGPDLNEPLAYRYNGASLINECIFVNSYVNLVRSSSWWSGRARFRGPVNPNINVVKYVINKYLGGSLPPSGNQGREHVRIYRTAHYREYVYLKSSGEYAVSFGWMPLVPFLSSKSFLEDNFTNILEQTVGHVVSAVDVDYTSLDGMNTLLGLTSSGDVPANLGHPDQEQFFSERKSFDDVYQVRLVRTLDGKGTRWPTHRRFYYNFRSPYVVWAWAEQGVGVVRNSAISSTDPLKVTSCLLGVKFGELEVESEVESDMYDRSIHYMLPEGFYSLKLEDQSYDEDGNVSSYASLYIDQKYKLYFDRYSGEIKEKKNDLLEESEKELYARDTEGEIADYYQELDYDITAYFKPVLQTQQDTLPFEVTGLKRFVNNGNLYVDPLRILAFFTQRDDAEKESDVEWYGFTPSVKIESILPGLMPKVEHSFLADGNPLVHGTATVEYSKHPTNVALDGKALSAVSEGIFCRGTPTIYVKEWQASTKDTEVSIEILLKVPLEVSGLEVLTKVSYEDSSNPPSPEQRRVVADPYFSLILTDISNRDYVLVEKPEQELSGFKKPLLERKYCFSVAVGSASSSVDESCVKMDDTIIVKSIRMDVGRRRNNMRFSLSPINLRFFMLNTSAEEEIAVHEPKLFISTGHFVVGDDLHQAAQDQNKLTGVVTNLSEAGDEMEFQGIAEYWRPLDFDKPAVRTEGKLRRHYANQLKTFDYFKYVNSNLYPLSDVEWFDPTVHESENRQYLLLDEFLNTVRSTNLLDKKLQYFLRPNDLHNVRRSLGFSSAQAAGSVSILSSLYSMILYELFDIEDYLHIGVGSQKTMWQDPGVQACFIGISNDCSGGAFNEPSTCRTAGGVLGHVKTYYAGNLFNFANYRQAINDVYFSGANQSGQALIDSEEQLRQASEKLSDALKYENYRQRLKDEKRIYKE